MTGFTENVLDFWRAAEKRLDAAGRSHKEVTEIQRKIEFWEEPSRAQVADAVAAFMAEVERATVCGHLKVVTIQIEPRIVQRPKHANDAGSRTWLLECRALLALSEHDRQKCRVCLTRAVKAEKST